MLALTTLDKKVTGAQIIKPNGEKKIAVWQPKENRSHDNVETLYPQHKTKLPLSVGSEGFDAQLDYVVKSIIPAHSLCSIYGASGSYKSFLAGAWAVIFPQVRHEWENRLLRVP